MAMPSPLDIWHIILAQSWLLGALLSVGAAALSCVGLVLQKKAQYQVMGSNVDADQPAPPLKQLLGKPLWWIGLLLFVLHSPVVNAALMYAPETTVTPLSATQVMVNFFLSFGVLYERFKRKDIVATLVCIVSTVVMNSATPTWMKSAPGGHLVDFPIKKALDFTADTWGNVGFMAYLCTWVVLLVICLYVISFVSVRNVAKPFAIPLLIGLLVSMTHFMGKISWTLIEEGRTKPLSWWTSEHELALLTVGITTVLYLSTLYAIVSGLRLLSCRYFVPATVVACEVLTVTQLLLFFRTYEGMTYSDILIFISSSFVAVVGLFFVDPEQTRIPSPTHSDLNSPLLKRGGGFNGDEIKLHHSVLAIMDEYKVRRPEPKNEKPLDAISMSSFPVTAVDRAWRFFPTVICIVTVLVPLSMVFVFDCIFPAFAFLTIFGLYQGWRLGLHIGVFAYVGVKKMAHFDNANFSALYEAEASVGRNKTGHSGPKWKDVVHFVVLPNYKEDIACLKLAIRSIAASSIAQMQIGLVLAMEAREQEAESKAKELERVFQKDFRYVFSTFHPVGLPGETPGKSANTKWAANRLFEDFMPAQKIDDRNAIITVADADSEFHSEYFAALSYYYCHAGGEDGQCADRYLTIWQAPILHFKNYIDQPSLVRLASFITSLHEVANLADPNATRVPYSTYSISAVLAKKVEGWDPDWISEDWHMALKCFFATGGRVRISPIFLPVMNYAPAADTWFETIQARWTQAKRHALGFSEMVYFGSNFFRVWKSLDTPWRKSVYKWRAGFLFLKLLMIHLVMASFFVTAPINGYLVSYLAHNEDIQRLDANTWTFLLSCISQALAGLSFLALFVMSVLVYEGVKHRIDGATIMGKDGPVNNPELSIFWRSEPLHLIGTFLQSVVSIPFFFAAAGIAEWIAAFKTMQGHMFQYDVAAKPKVAEDEGQPGSGAA